MPATTPFLGLVTYGRTTEDINSSFLTFRTDIAGSTPTSNMAKIDTQFNTVNDQIIQLGKNQGVKYTNITSDDGINYTGQMEDLETLIEGLFLGVSPNMANLASPSLKLNAFNARPLVKFIDGAQVGLQASDMRKNSIYLFRYSGTAFVLVGDTVNVSGTPGNIIKISDLNGLEDSGIGYDKVVTSNKNVTNGTFTKVTIDKQGLVTSGTTLVASDIPMLTLSKISDAGTAASKDVGTASGQIPILNASGNVVDSVIPSTISHAMTFGSSVTFNSTVLHVGSITLNNGKMILGKSTTGATVGLLFMGEDNYIHVGNGTQTLIADATVGVGTSSTDKKRIFHEGFAPTKAQVGLGNVDNTSDANKPISTAQKAEFDAVKLSITNILNGTTSGTFKGSLTGNATTATTLQTTRKIGNADFNGSANITAAQMGVQLGGVMLYSTPLTIAITSWVASSAYPDAPWEASITNSSVTAKDFLVVMPSVASGLTGLLADAVDSLAGSFKVYAYEKPTVALTLDNVLKFTLN